MARKLPIERVVITPRFEGTVDVRVVRGGKTEIILEDAQASLGEEVARQKAGKAPVINLNKPGIVHPSWGRA